MIQLPLWETLLRISVAAVCGGVIGIERGKKHRPAGFRTHMIVCMGAALTIVLSIYLSAMLANVWSVGLNSTTRTDISRFGAQVINGIGFLGAGTIIVTGRQQIKGMTTAAGLWASACMGLAIGAGFYTAAICACLLILITIVVFSKLERLILSRSRNMNLYVEYEHIDDVVAIISTIMSMDIRIFDVEIEKGRQSKSANPNAIFSVQLPKKLSHTDVFSSISAIESIRTIEEL